MSQDNDNPDSDTVATGQQPGPGTRLQAAREQAGMSVDDVARELHLDVAIVRAVEADELDGLGAPVFVKGYLRGYARLLDLPEQELVDAWQPAISDADTFGAQSVQTELRPGASLSNFVLWSLLGILVLSSMIYLLAGDDDEAIAEEAAPAVAEPAAALLPERDDEFVVEEAAAADFSIAAAEPEQEPVSAEVAAPSVEPEPPAVPAPPAQPVVASTTVTLTFSDECWVELSDSRRRLLYGLEKAGSVRSFAARPPLRFFVGNVEAVQVAINEQPYVIPARVRTGRNTARFELDADAIQGLQ